MDICYQERTMNSVDIAEDTGLACVAERALSEMAQVRPVLDKIADKWTILILIAICPKPARFNEIRRRLNGITHKALADALKRLERNGFVTRTVIPAAPIGVEYAITPLGHSLRQPFEALCSWALANGREMDDAGDRYDSVRNAAR
jgi:DNA-binding HxlR family transcriptional regulator